MKCMVPSCGTEMTVYNISDIDPEGIPLTPTTVEVGVKPMVIYYVYFEKENIGNDGEATFLDALKVAYALIFFILKSKVSTTMEFLQRIPKNTSRFRIKKKYQLFEKRFSILSTS
ncbi:hypothetical protein JTB14_028054 [Gonioctena quinquepunctata]|nr:hypothetical protein JTB14_028054 [Gonioctena quinquepunctata]